MGKSKLVSVIVPVFNAEKYLERIIFSLLKQTYKNIEIVLVDDGSQDASVNICDNYASLHERVKVIHISNGGAAKARNIGIQIARGEYIVFVDSDDDIVLDYVENLVETLETYDLDIMVCNYKKVSEKDLKEHNSLMGKINDVKVLTGEAALELMLYRKILTSGPCFKIIKNEIVKTEVFPEGKLFEDLGTVYRWYARATRVGYTDKVGYFYWQRNGSCQHSKYNPKKWDLIVISKEILKYVKQFKPNLISAANNRLFISAVQILRYIPYGEHCDQVNELKSIIKRYRKEIFINKKAKLSSRVLALIACINIDLIRIIGKIYDMVCTNFKILVQY